MATPDAMTDPTPMHTAVILEDYMTPKVLAYAVTIGFFSILGCMLFYPLQSGSAHEVLLIMIGSLGTSWSMIIGFYFGSSAGSQRQNRAMLSAQRMGPA